MQYRRFGRTNLQMPVFSCGGMRYQHSWKDVPESEIPIASQRNLEATIVRALEVGINHIETARGYGTSEVQLGKILPQFPREKLIVQTKVSPDPDPQAFRNTFEKSLRNLQLEYVDLLGLHGINNEELLDYSIRPGGCWEVAKQLQQEGKGRYIGFSTHGETDTILDAIESDLFDYVNLHWYYINQFNWQAIEAATRHDMGVFIISPSNKGGMLYEPSPTLSEICQPLSPMVFNDLFCLSHPQVHTLSIGADKPSDFDEHLKTLSLLDRADELLPPILHRWREVAIARFSDYFNSKETAREWYNTWHLGIPNFHHTPNHINVVVVLWLWNLATAYEMLDYGKMRYNLLGNADHWFPGNKADKLDNLHWTSCLQNSPHRDRIPAILADADRRLGGEAVKRLSQS